MSCYPYFKAGMAELADAADSKSAGLRPLGVQLPLPAPPAKAAPDAGSSQSDLPGREPIQTPAKSSCDRAVTGDGRNQTHWKVVGHANVASRALSTSLTGSRPQ